MVKTLKDYLEEGGIKGKSFMDGYNNPGRVYRIMEILPPVKISRPSDSPSGEIFMKILYRETMPCMTALRHHLNDLEVKVGASERHLSYPDSSIK